MRTSLCLLLTLLLAGCGNHAADYAALGRAEFDRGNYSPALDYLSVALTSRPEDPELRYMTAVCELRLRRTASALDRLQALLEEPAWRTRALTEIVTHLLDQDRVQEARNRVLAALDNAPGDVHLMQALGDVQRRIYEDARDQVAQLLDDFLGAGKGEEYRYLIRTLVTRPQGRFEQVFESRARMLLQREGFTEKETLRTRVMRARNELQRTLEQYEAVMDRNPGAYAPRLFVAWAAHLRGDRERALELYKEVAFLDRAKVSDPLKKPGLESARLQAIERIARLHADLEQHEQGLEFLRKVREYVASPRALDHHLARFHYATNGIDELEKVAGRILEENPRHAWGNYYMGYVLCTRAEELEGKARDRALHLAVDYLERAQAAAPEQGDFNRYLALALAGTGDHFQAIPRFEQALESGPVDAELVIAYARTWEALGEPQRALQALGDSLYRWFRGDREAREAVHAAHRRMLQRYGYGIDDLRSARALHQENPENVHVALTLAKLELEAGNLHQARTLAGDVQEKTPEIAQAWALGARTELALGHYEQALDQVRRAEELGHSGAGMAWTRAAALHGRGDPEPARESARRALSMDPRHVEAARLLVRIELDLERWEAARSAALQHLESFQEDRELLEMLVKAQSRLGDWAQAAATWERIRRLGDDSPGTALAHARAMLRSGDPRKARPLFSQAAELAGSQRPRLKLAAAQGLIEAGARQEAAPLLEEILEQRPPAAVRKEVLQAVMQTRHAAGDHLGTLLAGVELRREGAEAAAIQTLLPLAVEAGAFREAAAVADFARAADLELRGVGTAVLEARLGARDWNGALKEIRALEEAGATEPATLLLGRLRALVGMGRLEDAAPLMGGLGAQVSPEQRRRAWTLWARGIQRQGAFEAYSEDLHRALAMAPKKAPVQLAAAGAALARDDLDTAASHLGQAWALEPGSPRVLAPYTAVLVERSEYAKALEIAGDMDRVGPLLACLQGQDPPPRTLARYLGKLRDRRPDHARYQATVVADVPFTFRSALESLAAALEEDPDSGTVLVEPLARAVIHATLGALPRRALEEVRSLGAMDARTAKVARLFEAWILVETGRAREAAGLVMPHLDSKAPPDALVFLAGLAAVHNAGLSNLPRVVEGLTPGRDLAPLLAADLAGLLVRRKAWKQADRLLERAAAEVPEVLHLRALLALVEGDVKRALELSARFPRPLKGTPLNRLLDACNALRTPGDDEEARRRFAWLFRERDPLEHLDPRAVLHAVAATGEVDAIRLVVDKHLARQPYDAHGLNVAEQVLKGYSRPPGLADRLKAALSLVDPRGDLRAHPPESAAGSGDG